MTKTWWKCSACDFWLRSESMPPTCCCSVTKQPTAWVPLPEHGGEDRLTPAERAEVEKVRSDIKGWSDGYPMSKSLLAIIDEHLPRPKRLREVTVTGERFRWNGSHVERYIGGAWHVADYTDEVYKALKLLEASPYEETP